MPKAEHQDLSQETIDRVTRAVRSLAEDRVERGVDLTKPMQCSSCGEQKSPLGSARYGAYSLCNDCLLDFTLALAEGKVDTAAQFMTCRQEHAGPVSALSDERERSTLHSVPRPDRLMASNEPA